MAGKVERREGGCQGKFVSIIFPRLKVVIKIYSFVWSYILNYRCTVYWHLIHYSFDFILLYAINRATEPFSRDRDPGTDLAFP